MPFWIGVAAIWKAPVTFGSGIDPWSAVSTIAHCPCPTVAFRKSTNVSSAASCPSTASCISGLFTVQTWLM